MDLPVLLLGPLDCEKALKQCAKLLFCYGWVASSLLIAMPKLQVALIDEATEVQTLHGSFFCGCGIFCGRTDAELV